MNQIVTSKQDGIGVISHDVVSNKDGLQLSKIDIYCDFNNDNVTTYVLKSTWISAINGYLYPPYVECEYVA